MMVNWYLEVIANNLELADGLELHGFTGQVLLRRDGVGEDVEEHRAAAGGVHPERHDVVDDRLEGKRSNLLIVTLFFKAHVLILAIKN